MKQSKSAHHHPPSPDIQTSIGKTPTIGNPVTELPREEKT